MVYIPRKYRHYNAVLYLMFAECPIILPVLILTGIASHDTYTTRLWQDGANNGFNSAPNQIVYALTNGNSYAVPMVWSSFLYNYDLVIGVLSTFFILTKVPVHVLRFFHPPVSAFVHGALCVLYAAAASFQAGHDTTDSRHPQNGPPWYITKSCSVAYSPGNVGYCKQAKALFAMTVIATAIYFAQTVLALISCFTTKEEREAYHQRKEEKQEERDAEDRALREYEEILKSPAFGPGMPITPGLTPMQSAYFPGQHPQYQYGMSPYTPHFGGFVNSAPSPAAVAFTGYYQPQPSSISTSPSSDLPLRDPHFDVKTPSFGGRQITVTEVEQPYFPPPPKKATK
ncbi:hypothetical protein BGW36DRAFT_359518 [Talaromyces proteolyticus]|uniref:MARVEL domain-containing protein n=1 Tax=Talaromyces proteolyticus TaxID=1131652 RepID=A0AAD4Q0X1_9EURO|nr:uncharacterized protein BGW36DRAFT_359518 [Talaromyces proteolyticus]KAH8697741.1 hypothetical protein BGW36DRAFT_359518 [Talaromyces proteolyticus]